jgi:hypothetical protein
MNPNRAKMIFFVLIGFSVGGMLGGVIGFYTGIILNMTAAFVILIVGGILLVATGIYMQKLGDSTCGDSVETKP